MTVRLIDKESNLSVEVHLRPITPKNMIQRPEIVWKTKSKKQYIRSVYQPKVVIGYNQKDGSPIIAYPKMICAKCEGDLLLRCPDCNGLGKVLYVSEVKEANLKITEKGEEDCPTCKGKGKLDQPCDLCKGVGKLDYFTNYEKTEIDEEGKHVASDDKMSYEVKQDGTEAEFPIFSANDTMVVRMKMPKTKIDELYTESWAEIEATMKTVKKEKVHDSYSESELYRYAEELVAKNMVAVGTNFVKARGFQLWNFVIYPQIFADGTFDTLIGYWQAKKEMAHKRPIPKAVTVSQEQTIPARSYLPDIELLLK